MKHPLKDMLTHFGRTKRQWLRMERKVKAEGLNELKGKSDKPRKRVQYIPQWWLRIPPDHISPIKLTHVIHKMINTYSIHYFAESWHDGKTSSGWRNWTITREIVNALVQIKRIVKI